EMPEMEKFWCLEIVDRETGKCYRSYEFPETEADLYLDGRACVSNDDPQYEKESVTVCDTSLPRPYQVRYNASEGNTQGYADNSQNTQTYAENMRGYADNSQNSAGNYESEAENTRSNVPLQRIPVYDETEDVYGTSSMIVRGNNPESMSGNALGTESAPGWASPELAESAPAPQIADINPRTGQAMSPPPQPGISNTDVTPYTQHIGDPPTDGYTLGDWQRLSLPITAQMEETTTGRVMFSLGVSSDSGLVGSVVVDEQNFDIRRWPTSWSEIKNGTSWRGRGQHFRLELTPGTEVSRYVVSFDEPYLFNSQIGLGTSAMYYERQYRHWDERRVGGQFNLSRALTHDMRAYIGFRGYDVYLSDPVNPTPPRLANALGHSSLFGFSFRLVHDRRDSSFLATEGYYASMEIEQVVGTWSYPRFNAQFKKYWLLYERADMSGRHVLSFTSSFSWTGDNTPIYESYFAGGSSTIRGFEYRGVSPLEYGYAVGGNMMILASLEYLFPITADDNIRGVIFCDTGTVQPTIDQWEDAYRVSIGAGFRISMPMLGPAPMALDFAVPLVKEDGDRKELFSFTMGLQR
ncbi:MAG: BamA/TamA family outer membrane protein, partial [Planctomycetia bacterium]|nr:BamA/TamA family outer membrane protein [Planctomycetia bacterium]